MHYFMHSYTVEGNGNRSEIWN